MKYKLCISVVLASMIINCGIPVYAEKIADNENKRLVIYNSKTRDSITSEGAVNIDILEEYDKENCVYSVPIKMVQASNPKLDSMGNGAVDGNAIVTVNENGSFVDLNFKAVTLSGLYGHLLNIWSYPAADNMNYNWWDKPEYETPAEIVNTYMDYGMNYTLGDINKSEFIKTARLKRSDSKEDYIYIRINVDAMTGFDQVARIDFDWNNAEIVEEINDKKLQTPNVIPDKREAKNGEEVEIKIDSLDTDVKIYYTTDGTIPNASSKEYTETFKITGNNTSVIINVVAVSDNLTSNIGTAVVKFASSSSSSLDSSSMDDIEDGKYWMNFNLWNVNIDQASMGDCAFDNNRRALVTINRGTAKIEMAANPVAVNGYTSALRDIKSNEVNIIVDSKSKFTTNTRYDGNEHKVDYINKFSFNLNELNKEYINVEISVPFTPMDGIAASDGGYISARLKLNWSSLEKTGVNDKLSPDSTTASGSSGNSSSFTNYEDVESGVKIKADSYILPDDTEFTIKLIDGDSVYNSAAKLINGDFKIYGITAASSSENSRDVFPNGLADIYFPVKENDGNITIYRFTEETDNAEAGLTELEYKLSDDKKYYAVSVKKFGIFAIVKSESMDENIIDEHDDIKQDIISEETAVTFADVNGHWAEDYIVRAVDIGLFNGISEDKFAPDVFATRAMFVTVLGRLKCSVETEKDIEFNDVNKNDYFYPFIAWAVEAGILSGINKTTFAPNDNITREQMAVMLCNFVQNENIELGRLYRIVFSDNDSISGWAKNSVKVLSEAGILSGRANGAFDPKGTATRAEIATILIKFINEYMPDKLANEENIII